MRSCTAVTHQHRASPYAMTTAARMQVRTKKAIQMHMVLDRGFRSYLHPGSCCYGIGVPVR